MSYNTEEEFIEVFASVMDALLNEASKIGYIDIAEVKAYMDNNKREIASDEEIMFPMPIDRVACGLEARVEFILRLTFALMTFEPEDVYGAVYFSCLSFRSIGDGRCTEVYDDFKMTEELIGKLFGDTLDRHAMFNLGLVLIENRELCFKQTELLEKSRQFYMDKMYSTKKKDEKDFHLYQSDVVALDALDIADDDLEELEENDELEGCSLIDENEYE